MSNNIKQMQLAEQLEQQLDEVYDLFFQMLGNETKAVELAHLFARRVVSRNDADGYDRYRRLWMLRLAVELLENEYKPFLAAQEAGERTPFSYLGFLEKLVLFLRDRMGLEPGEMAVVCQHNIGRINQSLVYAREGVAKELLEQVWQDSAPLPQRLLENLTPNSATEYGRAVSAASHYIRSLPKKRFGAIEHAIRVVKIVPSMRVLSRRWSELSWQMKFLVEGAALGAVALLAVVVFPWVNARTNYAAIRDGRISEVFTQPYATSLLVDLKEEEVSTDRLLASAASADPVVIDPEFSDEFSNEEFPQGGGAEMGHSPLAPSRQNSAIYRLILQSPNPSEVANGIREIFSSEQVRERNSSGKSVPGGVYFDGITTEASVDKIRAAANQLGVTQTYATHENKRKPEDKARVIVWVQQI